MNFETVIGLEVHVELKTNSKMFSPSPSGFGAEPNSNTNAIDWGYPGVLPTPNEKGIELAIKAALALNCEINQETKFDRKNYVYPDNPKADRKSTRLNSSHVAISYAVFCLKKKKTAESTPRPSQRRYRSPARRSLTQRNR